MDNRFVPILLEFKIEGIYPDTSTMFWYCIDLQRYHSALRTAFTFWPIHHIWPKCSELEIAFRTVIMEKAGGRPRDEVWQHVKLLEGGRRVKCNYCQYEFAARANRIKSHINKDKGKGVRVCPNFPQSHNFASDNKGNSNHLNENFLHSQAIVREHLSNGYLLIATSGGLNQRRTGITNAVVVARILNVTLVVPELDHQSYWKDDSDFNNIFDANWFIAYLAKDVRIAKKVPNKVKRSMEKTPYTMRVPRKSEPEYYLDQVLPILLRR
ncbi:hypothetical protein K1719_039909 [Acacia pycnantha]|nr:hypothetical protein K1719_039909 [Acacia pycnantha]